MNPADLLVAAVIILVIAFAVASLISEKRSGKGCCGCRKCGGQPQLVEISEDADSME